VKLTLSNDPRDKLLAVLNWSIGKWRRGADYQRAPMYFYACLAWHQGLSTDDKETVLTGTAGNAYLTRAIHRC
jgi:hypothetical protein